MEDDEGPTAELGPLGVAELRLSGWFDWADCGAPALDPRPLGRRFLTFLPGTALPVSPVFEFDTSKKAYLVDVAVPCETGDNLKVSRDRKRERYSAIRAKLEERGYETLLDGFIIGTLGTWVSENDTVLKQLGIGRKYEPLFKRLGCRDAIAGSYSVWASRNRLHAQLGRTNQRH